MIAFDRRLRAWPVVNTEFGYEKAASGLPTYRVQQDWQEVIRRAYLIYLAGGYGVYYYDDTAWDVVKIDPEPPGYKRFRQLEGDARATALLADDSRGRSGRRRPLFDAPGQDLRVFCRTRKDRREPARAGEERGRGMDRHLDGRSGSRSDWWSGGLYAQQAQDVRSRAGLLIVRANQ